MVCRNIFCRRSCEAREREREEGRKGRRVETREETKSSRRRTIFVSLPHLVSTEYVAHLHRFSRSTNSTTRARTIMDETSRNWGKCEARMSSRLRRYVVVSSLLLVGPSLGLYQLDRQLTFYDSHLLSLDPCLS